MAENIVVNFEINTADIRTAADELLKMGKITQAEADAFKKVNLEAGNVKKTIKELTDVANKAATDVINSAVKQETAQKKSIENAKTLRQRLAEAKNEVTRLADEFGALDPRTLKAAKSAAVLKDQLGDLGATLNALNPDAKLTAFVQLGVGVSGAFAAAQGAMALFGEQNEDVEKAILKVQGALALTQGLNSVLQLGDAFKNLRAVLAISTVATQTLTIATGEQAVVTTAATASNYAFAASLSATGIGAIVVGIGLLIAALYKLKVSNDEAAESTEALQKKQADFAANQKLFADTFNAAVDRNLKQRDREIQILEATEGKEKEVFIAKIARLDAEAKARRNAIASGRLTEADQADQSEILKELATDRQVLEIGLTTFLKQQYRDRSDIEKATLRDNSIDTLREYVKIERAKTEELVLANVERSSLLDEFQKADVERVKNAEELKAQIKKESEQKAIELVFDTLDFISQLNQNAANKELQDLQIQRDYDLELAGDSKEKKLKIETEFAKKSTDIKRQAAQTAKAIAIFEAIIGTAVAIINQVKTTPLPAGAPLIALVSALGALQIGTVAAQPIPKFKKGTLSVPGQDLGRDSVYAMLQPGEAVIPVDKNRAYASTISAIYKGLINPSEINSFVNAKLNGGSGNTGSPSFSPYDFKHAMNGMRINVQNADAIGKAMASHLPESNPIINRRLNGL